MYRAKVGQSCSLPGEEYYFHPHISWSMISSGISSFRSFSEEFTFDIASPSLFCKTKEDYFPILGFLNTSTSNQFVKTLNPTLNNLTSDVLNIPLSLDENRLEELISIPSDSVKISKTDWDSFETSWDFQRHPMVGD